MPTIRHDKRIQAVLPLYFCIIPYHCGIVKRNKNICLHYFASVFFLLFFPRRLFGDSAKQFLCSSKQSRKCISIDGVEILCYNSYK